MLKSQMTSRQARAARAMLKWSVIDISEKANVATRTIVRLENEIGPRGTNAATAMAIQQAYESAGIEFAVSGAVNLHEPKQKTVDDGQRDTAEPK
jgi:DNA-binding XRE family transcriptional regulator